jgi:hypothetical protein
VCEEDDARMRRLLVIFMTTVAGAASLTAISAARPARSTRLVDRGALAAKAPAPAGAVFGGRTAQSWPIAIEVSKDLRQVVRADVGLHLRCIAGGFSNQIDNYRKLPLSATGSFSSSFSQNGVDVGNGIKADFAGSMKGKLNARRTSGTGTWSLKFAVHDATGAVTDTCDSGLVTWKVKQ